MARTKAKQLDVQDEFFKAIIGSAVSIVLPGAGSLAVAGYKQLTAQSLNQELSTALQRAMVTAVASADVPMYAIGAQAKGWWRNQKIKRAVKGSVAFSELYDASLKRIEGVAASPDPEDLVGPAAGDDPAEEGQLKLSQLAPELTKMAFAQLTLARTSGHVPGTWQDGFDDHLEILAGMGLKDSKHGPTWRELITCSKKSKPSSAKIAKWSRLACEAFAVQMADAPNLGPYLERLAEHDQRASEGAFLWQLDHQRRAINLVAFVLLIIAAEYGTNVLT